MPSGRSIFRLLRYSFLLDDPIGYLRSYEGIPQGMSLIDIIEMHGAIPRIREIISSVIEKESYSFERDEKNLKREAVSLYSAMIVTSSVKDNWLMNRFSISIAKSFGEELNGFDEETMIKIARDYLKIGVRFLAEPLVIPIRKLSRGDQRKSFTFSITIFDYMRLGKRLEGDEKWRFSNQLISGGMVYIQRAELQRLMEEAVYYKVLDKLKSISNDISDISILPPQLKDIAVEVQSQVAKRRISFYGESQIGGEGGGAIAYKPELFPPCIKNILRKASNGENLSHQERFQIATFLLNLNVSIDDVLEVFKQLPDYNEKIARYQVEHLAGKRGSGIKYKPYDCEKSKAIGLCVEDCGTKTPIQKYKIELRKHLKKGGDNNNKSRDV